MKRSFLLKLLPSVALAACLLVVIGCASTGEFGDRTVVVIYNEKPEEIISATTEAFLSKGFIRTYDSDDEAVFERKGSTMQNLAYGSWMEGSIWERATLTVEPYGKGANLLEAKVERISNKNDDFFTDKKQMSKRARKPFQEMLDQIAFKLNGFPAGTNDAK